MKFGVVLLAFLNTIAISKPNLPSATCEQVAPVVAILDSEVAHIITVEEYVAGVVAHEVPHTFESEAMKAQAVAARTYLYYSLLNNSHPHKDADVCTDITHCCGYITESELSERYGEKYAADAIKAALEAAYSTEGEVMLYEGEPILALWHSSSAATTEDCEAVFMSPLPYLVSVPTPESASSSVVSYSISEARACLAAAGYNCSGKLSVSRTETESGRCASLTIGDVTVSGTEARRIFGLRSADFGVYTFGPRIYFLVNGYGHGVGLSQYGANTMAEGGASYREILTHYYNGATLGEYR